MTRRALVCEIRLNGRRLRSETLLAEPGAFVLCLSTCLPDLGVAIDSTYLGHRGADTRITHLLVAPRRAPETESHSCPHGRLPVTHARGRCLYDHFGRVQDLIRDLELGELRVAELDGALQLVES